MLFQAKTSNLDEQSILSQDCTSHGEAPALRSGHRE